MERFGHETCLENKFSVWWNSFNIAGQTNQFILAQIDLLKL